MLETPDCEKIENFVTRRGRLRKIWGTSLYGNATFGADEIKWLDYFRNRWLFQRADGIGLETAEGSGAFLQLGTIFGGERRRAFSDKWTDSVFLSNGFENKFVDFLVTGGPKLFNVGLLPPGGGFVLADSYLIGFPQSATLPVAAAASVIPLVGSDIEVGSYQYLVTLWDNERKVESLPYGAYVGEDGLWEYDSASTVTSGQPNGLDSRNWTMRDPLGARLLAINITAVDQAIQLDFTNIFALGYDTDRVTHYIVYRKALDGTYKRVSVTDSVTAVTDFKTLITSPVFVDSVADAALGEVIDFSLSPPPGGKYYRDSAVIEAKDYGAKFVKQHRDQLWMFGVNYPGTENGYEANGQTSTAQDARFNPLTGVAYASEVGQSDYWKFTYDIGRATGQKDTFLGKHRNTLMFFKEAASFYLDGSAPANYEIRELDNKRGITVSGSAQETTKGIIGLGAEGFTLFDSIGPASIISETIADMVEKINLTYADKINSSFDPEEEKYECHCPIENGHNTLVFIYDLKQSAWSFTKRAGGAAHYGLSSAKRTVGLLGDSQGDKLYLTTDRSVVTFNGQTMHGVWRSKNFDFGDPGKIKTLKMVTIVARAKRDFRLSIDAIPDFEQNNPSSVNDIDPDVSEDVLAAGLTDTDGMIWDEGQWGRGVVKKNFTILVDSMGKYLQLVIRNSDTDADRANFEIEEVILWASMEPGENAK